VEADLENRRRFSAIMNMDGLNIADDSQILLCD
jgi:hypothetical protein